jgi:hypothetical protein
LAAVVIPTVKSHIIARVIRGLYKARNRQRSSELKSINLCERERAQFARQLLEIKKIHPDIFFHAITVKKAGVNAALRKHPNGLYNYMTKLMLLEKMGGYPQIDFIPDARSVKVNLKHAFHDYLCTELAINGFNTVLTTTPYESRDHFEIQFADILASLVWSHFEFADSCFQTVQEHITHRKLYFSGSNNEYIQRASEIDEDIKVS